MAISYGGLPLDEVQKSLLHKRITTTQIYADTSRQGISENYLRAFGEKAESLRV